MNLRCYRITEDCVLEPLAVDSVSPRWLEDDVHRWVDVRAAEPQELQPLLAPLNLHPPLLESALEPRSLGHFAHYNDGLYVRFPTQSALDQTQLSLSILCLPTTIITIQHDSVQALLTLAKELSGSIRLRSQTDEALLYEILDHLSDENAPCAFTLSDQVDQLADRLDEELDSVEVSEIQLLKRRVTRLSSTLQDQLYSVGNLQSVHSKAFKVADHAKYYRDLIRRLENGVRAISRLEDRLRDLHLYYHLALQDRTESRLRVLTILSAVIMPMTLLTGIYGMNFKDMPELDWRYGYPVVLGIMVTVLVSLLWFFRRQGWFR